MPLIIIGACNSWLGGARKDCQASRRRRRRRVAYESQSRNDSFRKWNFSGVLIAARGSASSTPPGRTEVLSAAWRITISGNRWSASYPLGAGMAHFNAIPTEPSEWLEGVDLSHHQHHQWNLVVIYRDCLNTKHSLHCPPLLPRRTYLRME